MKVVKLFVAALLIFSLFAWRRGLLPIGAVQAKDATPAYRDKSLPIEQRITDLISRMTLEEKVRMCFGGERPGYVQLYGVPRLGIPSLMPVDGPRGVTQAATATAFPTGIGLTASWDFDLEKQVGVVIGQEARAVGKTMILGPAINIDRDPLDGRFFEYTTEDPYLNAELAPAMIEGIQSQRVAACVKHFVCNNRELNRDWYMSNVDERTLHEIYFPGFRSAVQVGKTWGVMTAANGVNGSLAATNKYLIRDVLKDRWGFQGLVLTDFNQARSTLGAARAGLDIGMPWGTWATTPFGKPLMDAVLDGQVPESNINDKVRRIFRVMAFVGLLDGVSPTDGGSINTPEHQALALRAAESSMVLLKNEHSTLPLSRASLKRIVVLGPNANRKLCKHGFGGSSAVEAPFEVTPLDGLRKELAGKAEVDYIDTGDTNDFEPIGPQYWAPIDGEHGLLAKYENDGEKGPSLIRVEPQVNFTWEMSSPDPHKIHTDNFNATFVGKLVPEVSGFYTLRMQGEDTFSMTIDRNPILISKTSGAVATESSGIQLNVGTSYDVEIHYHAGTGDASLRLDWSLPQSEKQVADNIRRLRPKLEGADAVIFVGGWDHSMDTEGLDRQNMDFPEGQQETINAVAAINPRTVVVLIHGSPFRVDGWIHSVPAVLDAFYPGMEGGTAIAEAILGDINPSGRLTFTWPKRLEDSPAHAVGTENHDEVNYKEGVFVGYRYFDEHHIGPSFPFGFGLTYSSFNLSNLQTTMVPDGDVKVSLHVLNTSQRKGVEVVQLYVGAPKSPVPRPLRELKGYSRVEIAAGETQTVSMILKRADLAYWSVPKHGWQVQPGTYRLFVGSSSRDLPLASSIRVSSR
jgi:beta-glucosidase